MAARSAEHVHFLNKPMPFAFCFAALFLAAATRDLNLCWPFLRLPPTRRAFFAFFFLRFFFFFAFFFFFFFFFFFGLAFLAFFAFLGFFAAFFFAGFFFAAVFCAVRASVSLRIACLTTVVSVATIGSSSNTMMMSAVRVRCRVCPPM